MEKRDEIMANIKINLDIDNVGPHQKLQFKDETSSIKIGLYANNGAGKTFISRAFRLVSHINDFSLLDSSQTNKLLTTDEKKGTFLFKITDLNDPDSVKKLEIKLNRNSKPLINDNTGYFFHVFNSDYVAENLELNGYIPPSKDIQGYIIGKPHIDVTKEKLKLEELIENQEKIHKKIKEGIKKAHEELDTLKISKNTTEYKQIKFENVIATIDVDEDESFDILKTEYQKLKTMPDGLDDVLILDYNIDNSLLNDVKKLLSTVYNKSNLPQDFVDKIKFKQKFIEEGIELYDSDTKKCPFCKQKLDETAIKIITCYNDYIQDSEAKTIREINEVIDKLKELKRDIEIHYSKFDNINVNFNYIKQFLPSSKKNKLKILSNNEKALNEIDELIEMLSIKKENIESTKFEFEHQINNINNFLDQLKKELKDQIEDINAINQAKNDVEKEKLKLRRRLCNARYLGIITEQKENLQGNKKLNSDISVLKNDIERKESESKIDKKKEVIKSLKYFLNFFFRDKYKFDDENFCIKFKDKSLSDNATHVLSDGEKGIVAFCYYLATVHMIIKRESDYKKLFFIIDDPISSMDYNFVYAVAQSIRKIKDHFDVERNRFIILTHNLEFMNLLKENKIVAHQYILKKNTINGWSNKLMLPYEHHLADIIEISKKDINNVDENRLHTIPNSIRHVLETICKFEYRNKDIGEFISEKSELNENGHIYTLIQALSHGTLSSAPINDEIVINACKDVVNFIREDYPGQIDT